MLCHGLLCLAEAPASFVSVFLPFRRMQAFNPLHHSALSRHAHAYRHSLLSATGSSGAGAASTDTPAAPAKDGGPPAVPTEVVVRRVAGERADAAGSRSGGDDKTASCVGATSGSADLAASASALARASALAAAASTAAASGCRKTYL